MKPDLIIITAESGQIKITPDALETMLDKWYRAGYEDGQKSSAKPQEKKGEWIPQLSGFKDAYKCSACKKITVMPVKPYSHCPECGADMRRAEDE